MCEQAGARYVETSTHSAFLAPDMVEMIAAARQQTALTTPAI
jgi:hypothetical protein